MIRSPNPLLLALFSVMLTIMGLNISSAKDIRDKVVNETILDEEITRFCIQYCQGNERKGYLESLVIEPMNDSGRYRVVGRASLQNRHVIRDPFEFVLYDHTVIVNAFGTLNPDNCELRIDNAFVENDFHDIFKTLLRNHTDVIGRVEKIPDCRRFLE